VGSYRSTNGIEVKMKMHEKMYVLLGRYTQKGIENIKDSPDRLEAARRAAKAKGGEIKEFYYTMGQYDFVAICQAPNDEAMTAVLLMIGSKGAVKTETLLAIPAEKGVEIIKGLP
jgi:uncharacterized protein with GYD domain